MGITKIYRIHPENLPKIEPGGEYHKFIFACNNTDCEVEFIYVYTSDVLQQEEWDYYCIECGLVLTFCELIRSGE